MTASEHQVCCSRLWTDRDDFRLADSFSVFGDLTAALVSIREIEAVIPSFARGS